MSTVQAGDGTRLSFRTAGDPAAPPLVLLHGWAQSGECWASVLAGLAAVHHVIAPDLRGHGRSQAPAAGYDDPAVWADDLDAVLAAARVSAPPVLLGWSYGGLVACDWLRQGGTAAGLVLVGAVTGLGRGRAGGRVGPAMRAALPAALSTDPSLAVPALAAFVEAMTTNGPTAQGMLGAALATPPRVRAALFARECDSDAVLGGFAGPSLVLHGSADAVVDPSAGAHAAALLPQVRVSAWDGGGHAPFLEDPTRFVDEVASLGAGAG